MTSIRFRMIGVALFVVALSALEAYQWNGGPEDKAKITACVGGSVSFPWSIVMGRDGETMLGRDWWFQAPDREKTQIATYESKHFYATENSRVAFLPNAGLSLRDARPQDSGNYSVQVKLQNNRTLASLYRTVTLTVTDRPPATQDGALYVTLSDAVRDDVTENWSLQLHCGQFLDLGHPPVDVIWKTPSGEVKTSSYQDNGTFVLSVSSPVHGGNYFCRLPLSAPAASCLTATSLLNASAQLYVDDKDVMLSLLDARQREQEQAIEDQANLLEHQAMQISQQNETMADMVQVNKDQANLLQHQALQISQQNENMTDMVQVKKDQALQLHEQSLYLNQTISELTKLSCLMSARNTSSCADWLAVDPLSGIHTVCLSGESVSVYCDQTSDNGGWTVFQRRQDASVDFYRDWTDYRNGFGDLEGNFWLGLDKLHKLTTSQRFELRVDLQKCDGTKGNATYSGFYVEDVSHNFTLRFDKFTGGNAGDSLSYHRGFQFSTKDRDHDTFSGKSCAQGSHGAWWYGYCSQSDLNKPYNPNSRDGIHLPFYWNAFSNRGINALKFSEMKIRPI
ncbi:fibrinogen C domain-containing protein 1-like [Littorina saxatilis]|uniref:Fibrinogen C-terminal domain-containing protein n=1 Tax=Littorina saxatilis TaxID=31220 RepID=A0AAN9G586_9CAEN